MPEPRFSLTSRVSCLKTGRMTEATPTRDWKQSARRSHGVAKHEARETRHILEASRMLWSAWRLGKRHP